MAFLVKVEIISREIIKPCSPTPKTQQIFNFSAIDQLVPKIYIPLISFYFSNVSQQSVHGQVLKTSLSKVLTRFYPFAGRIKDHKMIECNDEGIEYFEARVNVELPHILRDPHTEKLRLLVPVVEVNSQGEATSNALLQIQVSFFECGGMAIGVCFSHKIADASTFATFLKAWSNEASGYGEVIVPLYPASLLFPPIDKSSLSIAIPRSEDLLRNRYVFNSSSIAELRNMASSISVPNPTRVEVVTALIWKCFIRVYSPRPCFCTHVLNLRKRLTPPLEGHTIGNIVTGTGTVQVDIEEIEIKDLVCHLREKIQAHKNVDGNKLAENLFHYVHAQDKMHGDREEVNNIVKFSGWCKLPFYETDFGWGKPAWVAYLSSLFPNSFAMIDTKEGDGIEVWACLSKDDANFLQFDQEFLSFASVNPSVLSP